MFIYNAHLIEDYLNQNEDNLEDDEIQSIVDLFNEEIRRWNETDAFARTKINFSVRLVKKFVDCIRLNGKGSWKDLSTIYQRLESAAEIANAERELAQLTGVNNSASENEKEYINPKTGKPYNKWRAYIEVDGTRTYLGDFDTKKEAIKARKEAGEKAGA